MDCLNKGLRFLFLTVIVRFIVLFIIGLNVRHRDRLPIKGPAIIISNHNSHLDTMVLMNLLPARILPSVHPVAAADYFLKNKFIAWFAQKIVGIIPISRKGSAKTHDPLTPCYEALDKNQILVLFPEGTRGEPEQLSQFKRGIAFLAEKYPAVPIIPVFMHGLGKSLPKGEYMLVPFFCDVFVGEPLYGESDKENFMRVLTEKFAELTTEGSYPAWE